MDSSQRHLVDDQLGDEGQGTGELQEPETTMCSSHPADDALMQFLQAL